jgi:hypothetical protein
VRSSFPPRGNRPTAGRTARKRTSPDELFRRLDGRELTVLGRQWTIEVYSVRDEQGHRWVQMRLGSSSSSKWLVLRLPAGAGERHVILAASSGLARPLKALRRAAQGKRLGQGDVIQMYPQACAGGKSSRS